MGIIAVDTETTGLDSFHGCVPFFVSIAFDEGKGSQLCWEWDVNPVNRQLSQDISEDVQEIQAYIDDADEVIFHNVLFDALMFRAIGVTLPWHKIIDTMRCSHLLASSEAKSLETLSLLYFGMDIKPLKDHLRKQVQHCRRIVKSKLPHWRRGTDEDPMLPSGGGIDSDYWMLQCLIDRKPDLVPELFNEDDTPIWQEGDAIEKHPWNGLLAQYGNVDTLTTLAVYKVMIERIQEGPYESIFREMNRQNELVFNLAVNGVTANWNRLQRTISKFNLESIVLGQTCRKIARVRGYDLELPRTGNNGSLLKFVFEEMEIPAVVKTKKGNPSLDKEAIGKYVEILPPESDEQNFFACLQRKRKLDTATTYLNAYWRFGIPLGKETLRLHPSYNTSKNVTLRWASYNPNSQNISKQEGFNCRVPYGPGPGRKWASLDYDNLELRLPAYECGEPAMLELFEHPDRDPYFGSYHLLIFSILHPDKYDKRDPQGLIKARDKYKASWYQWTKNGNFAEMYGAVDTKDGNSTADIAFHMPGAQSIVASRLKKKAGLNEYYVSFAQKNGYVETMPDRTVNPLHGYPLQCPRNYWGKVRPTVPLNYHIQGTAMWVIIRAMFKVEDYLKTLPGWFITLQVHDEIVIDFPANYPNYETHLNHIRSLMESIGEDISIPLTCGCTVHDEHWAKGKDL